MVYFSFPNLYSLSLMKDVIKAAAALIAAAASGGDPEIANKIIEKMMSGKKKVWSAKKGKDKE